MNRREQNRAILAFGDDRYDEFMEFVNTLSPEDMIDFLFYVKEEHDTYFRGIFFHIAQNFIGRKRRGTL